jgi:hypothetical protein
MSNELTPLEDQQAGFIRETLASVGEFRPFALFDEPLDCIRVVLRDCSVTEIRISDLLTLLEANYPTAAGQSEIVGFTFKGVAHICATHNIPASTPWKLADIFDALLRVAPPRDRIIGRNLVQPLVQELRDLEVEKIAA